MNAYAPDFAYPAEFNMFWQSLLQLSGAGFSGPDRSHMAYRDTRKAFPIAGATLNRRGLEESKDFYQFVFRF